MHTDNVDFHDNNRNFYFSAEFLLNTCIMNTIWGLIIANFKKFNVSNWNIIIRKKLKYCPKNI